MKVSIITVCFNAEKTIEQTINSVLNQTYQNIEYIIIDGNSKDKTLEIVGKYDQISKVISEPDNGIYDGMNKGVKHATGDVVGIINADDFYTNNNVIEQVVKTFQQSPTAQALYADLQYVDSDDLSRVTRTWISGEYKRLKFLNGWMPPHPTFFLKRDNYNKYGLFTQNFASAADYELMLRMLFKHNLQCLYLNEIIIKMRVGGVSNSSIKNRIQANLDDRKAWEINGLKPRWYTLYLKPISKLAQFIKR